MLVGLGAGWLLGRQAFRARTDSLRLADQGEPLLALAGLLASYGAAELVGGYGFLAVFACAMRLRSAESGHSYHRAMHGVVERLERLMTLLVLLVLGMAMTRGLLDAPRLARRGRRRLRSCSWCARWRGTSPSRIVPRDGARSTAGSTGARRLAVAFFGVRGVGSLFYLAYATSHDARARASRGCGRRSPSP